MPIDLTSDQARLLRMRAQGLDRRRTAERTVESVVHDCAGIQAQELRHASLGVRARSRGLTAADVEAARIDDRSIVRTWCMRGTRHLVTGADLAWLLPLFGPLYVGRGQRRLADLGLAEDDADRAVEIVRDELARRGQLTREAVAECLLREGLEFDPDGQAPYHVVRRCCLEGVACEAAPREEGEALTRAESETYALLDDWVSIDPPIDEETALAEFARRYLSAYEPATPEDLYAWSGLYKRDVRAAWSAIEDELTEVSVDGERAWTISDPAAVDPLGDPPDEPADHPAERPADEPVESPGEPLVRLLPMYDGYLLGHEDRELLVPDAYADRVHPGGGQLRATVVVDGLVVGTWALDRSRATPTVTVEPFDGVDPAVESGIEREVEDVGRFLGHDVTLEVDD